MKIAHYLPYDYDYHPWWLEKIAQTLAHGLSTFTKSEAMIITSDIGMPNADSPTKAIITNQDADLCQTYHLPSWEMVSNFAIPRLWKSAFWHHYDTIKTFEPDLIITHTRFFVWSVVGGIVAKLLGKPRVHIEHGMGFVQGYPRYIRWIAWIVDRTRWWWIFRQCDHIITISDQHTSFIQHFTHKKPTVIYNPIDYQPRKRRDNSQAHIGFIGRLVPLKGVHLLISALSELQDQERRCTIVGSGSEETKLKELAKTLGLEKRIEFIGAKDRADYLHTFDILVNPSYQEGLPTTVVEGLIAQCLVVSTCVGATNEINAWSDLILIQPDNSTILAQTLQNLLHNKSYRTYQGLSSSQVQAQFDTDRIIKHYHDVLQSLLSSRSLWLLPNQPNH